MKKSTDDRDDVKPSHLAILLFIFVDLRLLLTAGLARTKMMNVLS